MALRAPIGGGRQRWQMRRDNLDYKSKFVAECLQLWDQGWDTYDIAIFLFQPESIVYTATRLGREGRRMMRGKTNAGSGPEEKEKDEGA